MFICTKIQSKQGNIKHPFANQPIFQLRTLIDFELEMFNTYMDWFDFRQIRVSTVVDSRYLSPASSKEEGDDGGKVESLHRDPSCSLTPFSCFKLYY